MKVKKNKEIKSDLKLVIVGLMAGIVNGFFGAGGGLIIVPMLKKISDSDSKIIHATTLGCVMFMCLSSSIVYLTNGIVDFKLTLFCLIGSLIGSFVATKLLKKLKNNYIDLIFSFVLIAAGISLLII